MFLSPTNAPLYYTYKMLKCTVKISIAPTCFGPHGASSGPCGPKHVAAIMRYFNRTF